MEQGTNLKANHNSQFLLDRYDVAFSNGTKILI